MSAKIIFRPICWITEFYRTIRHNSVISGHDFVIESKNVEEKTKFLKELKDIKEVLETKNINRIIDVVDEKIEKLEEDIEGNPFRDELVCEVCGYRSKPKVKGDSL